MTPASILVGLALNAIVGLFFYVLTKWQNQQQELQLQAQFNKTNWLVLILGFVSVIVLVAACNCTRKSA